MFRFAMIIVALSALAAGCAKSPAGGDASAGKVLFDQHCAVCHGPDGDIREAPNYAAETPDLRKVAERAGGRVPRVMLAKIIDGRRIVQAHGSRTMPAWGERLGADDDSSAAEDVDDLVAYIESIQAK